MSLTDWFALSTTVGTISLALATIRVADRPGEAARVDDLPVGLERDQVRQADLPVVVPVIGRLDVRAIPDRDPGGKALEVGTVIVTIPIANLGAASAFGVELDIHWLDEVGNRSAGPQPMKIPAKIAEMAPAHGWEMQARFRGLATPPLPFRLSIGFSDTTGTRYLTRGRYFPEEELFREIAVSVLDPVAGAHSRSSGSEDDRAVTRHESEPVRVPQSVSAAPRRRQSVCR